MHSTLFGNTTAYTRRRYPFFVYSLLVHVVVLGTVVGIEILDNLINIKLPAFEAAQIPPPRKVALVWHKVGDDFPAVQASRQPSALIEKAIARRKARRTIMTLPAPPKLTSQYIVTENTKKILSKI